MGVHPGRRSSSGTVEKASPPPKATYALTKPFGALRDPSEPFRNSSKSFRFVSRLSGDLFLGPSRLSIRRSGSNLHGGSKDILGRISILRKPVCSSRSLDTWRGPQAEISQARRSFLTELHRRFPGEVCQLTDNEAGTPLCLDIHKKSLRGP